MTPGDPLRQLSWIWGALVGGVILYTSLIYGLVVSGTLDMQALEPEVMNLVGAAVIVYMVAVVWARRVMISRIASDATPEARADRYRVATIVS